MPLYWLLPNRRKWLRFKLALTFLEHVLRQHSETTIYKEPTHYVFCREDGSPLDPDHMRNYVLYRAMDAAKIERQKRGSGLHMFRHTAGSVVYALTGDLNKAQDQLGPADIQTTGKFYVHTDDAQKEAAASALELAFAADLQSAFANPLPSPATQAN